MWHVQRADAASVAVDAAGADDDDDDDDDDENGGGGGGGNESDASVDGIGANGLARA